MAIREATVADTEAIQHICLVTGASGSDATGRFCDDLAVSDVYATPYLHGPACFAFVVEADDAVVGYILGTSDTRAFQAWFSSVWWPAVKGNRVARTSDDEWLLPGAADPARMLNPHVDDYPAHLHIDLLPEHQGHGWGRSLIQAMVAELQDRAVAGVHLEASLDNHGAQAFYPRVGFTELSRTEDVVRWGMRW